MNHSGTSDPIFSRRSTQTILILSLALFIALAAGSLMTKRPWSDEGWFASAGFTLAEKGYMGTPVMDESGTGLTGIRKRTYWVLPFYFLTQAAWYKVWGFHLFTMRALSLCLGLIAAGCWYCILQRLAGPAVAVVGTTLIATDYYFVQAGSFGRYDMLCLTLGAAAIWVYLRWRETHLREALFLGQCLLCAGGLTHFLGVMAFLWFWILVMWLDRSRLRIQHILLCAIPYLVGAGLWYNYIRQSPEDFRAQFLTTATTAGRVSGVSAPLTAVSREFLERYLIGFGLGPHSAAHSGPIWMKSFILLAWLAGVGICLVVRELRRRPVVRALLALAFIEFWTMTLLDGHKQTWYLVYITLPFAALLAVALEWFWQQFPRLRWVAAMCCIGLIGLQAGGSALRMRINVYKNQFLPAAMYLNQNAKPEHLVMGSAELGFGIGFDRNLVDDILIGFNSGLRPEFIVLESNWQGLMEVFRTERPPVFAHMQRLYAEEYRLVYDDNGYKIWQRLPRANP
jgi:4-amino-4-deoxy-L-arabinose transferase-like glycosyltransferase